MSDWKACEINGPSEEFSMFREYMVSELKKINREKIPPTTKQPESTARLLALSDEEAEKRRSEIFDPLYWMKLKETAQTGTAESVEQDLAETAARVGAHNIIVEENRRRSQKNTLGESQLSSASDERKELARQAFTCTPPAPLNSVEKQKITELEKLQEIKEPVYEWRPLTTWQAFKHWIKGGKIKREDEIG